MSRTIDLDRINRPISESNPAGDDLVYDAVYIELEESRSNAEGPNGKRREPDWNQVVRIGIDALENRSKDLQIAAYVTEALGWLQGLDGLRQGFDLLRVLQESFWSTAYPVLHGDDLGDRLVPHESLDATIPPILHVAIPLTEMPAGDNYNLREFNSVQTQGEKEARSDAIRRTDVRFHQRLDHDLSACRTAFEAWRSDTASHLKRGKAPALRQVSHFLDELNACLKTIVSIRPLPIPVTTPLAASTVGVEVEETPARPTETRPDSTGGKSTASEGEPAAPRVSVSGSDPSGGPPDLRRDLTREVRELAAAGRIDAAIDLLDQARQTARCRRDRFIRQLEMVELCVRGGLIPLARPLLDELAGEVVERRLEDWEDPALCGRVLEASLACRRHSPTDDDVREIPDIFKKLCLLDPRRAMDQRPDRG